MALSFRSLTAALSASSAAVRAAPLSSVAGSSSSFKLPDLSYDYAALEPHLSADIMELHHSKHHQTYVTNLNNALDAYGDAEAKGDVAAMIALQPAIKFNGGGHVNHSMFWEMLAPPSAGGGGEPTGELKTYIDAAFGSFDVRAALVVVWVLCGCCCCFVFVWVAVIVFYVAAARRPALSAGL